MTDQLLASFASPAKHAAISAMIRRHSRHPADVRDVALAGREIGAARDILDLGCGFGFMAERVLPLTAPNARIVGVDACEENQAVFLQTVERARRQGEFRCQRVEASLPWPKESFDLVVASYSLYFFAEVIPEVARMLRPAGRFLALTHSETSFHELIRAAGLSESRSPLLQLIRNFSAENGAPQLRVWFTEVQRTDYPNSLHFAPEHQESLLQYARFKLPLLIPNAEAPILSPSLADLEQRLVQALCRQGGLVVEKNDAAFWCEGPKP